MKKYSLCKFAGYYICSSIYEDFYLETYIKDLEKELSYLENGNKVEIFFNLIVNRESSKLLKTVFENNKINYAKLVLESLE